MSPALCRSKLYKLRFQLKSRLGGVLSYSRLSRAYPLFKFIARGEYWAALALVGSMNRQAYSFPSLRRTHGQVQVFCDFLPATKHFHRPLRFRSQSWSRNLSYIYACLFGSSLLFSVNTSGGT